AALRMGSGLVQIAVPKAILPFALSITPELIGIGLGKKSCGLLEAAQAAHVVIVGPGMGTTSEARERLMRLVRLEKARVIDAGALNLLAMQKKWLPSFKAKSVLTPHPGEMRRLVKLLGITDVPTDDEGRTGLATSVAREFGQIVVLKG